MNLITILSLSFLLVSGYASAEPWCGSPEPELHPPHRPNRPPRIILARGCNNPPKGLPYEGSPQRGHPQQGNPRQGRPQQGRPQPQDPQPHDPQPQDPQPQDPQPQDPQPHDPQPQDPQPQDPQPQDPQPEDPQPEDPKNNKWPKCNLLQTRCGPSCIPRGIGCCNIVLGTHCLGGYHCIKGLHHHPQAQCCPDGKNCTGRNSTLATAAISATATASTWLPRETVSRSEAPAQTSVAPGTENGPSGGNISTITPEATSSAVSSIKRDDMMVVVIAVLLGSWVGMV